MEVEYQWPQQVELDWKSAYGEWLRDAENGKVNLHLVAASTAETEDRESVEEELCTLFCVQKRGGASCGEGHQYPRSV